MSSLLTCVCGFSHLVGFLASSSYSLLLSRCSNFSFFLFPFIERKKLTEQPPIISTGELKKLLELTRESFLDLCNTGLPKPVLQKAVDKTRSCTVTFGKYYCLENTLLILLQCIFIPVANFFTKRRRVFYQKKEK